MDLSACNSKGRSQQGQPSVPALALSEWVGGGRSDKKGTGTT